MSSPIVAILLSTYNGERYIAEFLDSLIEQSYSEFKLIIRDDGSSDKTLEIIQNYQGLLNIECYESDKNLGAAGSFMQLLSLAGSGYKYYFFADQDDVWHRNKISRAIEKIQHLDKRIALYFSALEIVDSGLMHISYSNVPRLISFKNALVENIATGCASVINANARNLIISRPPERVLMHDWWVYLVCSAFGEIVFDEFPTIKYRQHGANVIGSATSLFDDYKRRLFRFLHSPKDGIFCVSDQAREFSNCYLDLLSDEQRRLVRMLIYGQDKIYQRILLAIKSPYVRQRRFDTFILRLLFLFGRF